MIFWILLNLFHRYFYNDTEDIVIRVLMYF